jgi:hypothetical protein
MNWFAEKQARIVQQRDELIARYPTLWNNIVTEWKSPDPDDRVWLTYSANYLFRTGGVRWALDPLTLNWRLNGSTSRVNVNDLSDLSFILLTHRHKDHLDLDLLSELRHFSIKWVIPEYLIPIVNCQAGIPRKNIIVSEPLQPVKLSGITITPFDGLHLAYENDGKLRGVPATGYLIEFNHKRWLFPGDIRSYDASRLPNFGHLDGQFAHLWMGRGCALSDPPPLLESFCHFFASQDSFRIVITHLMDFGRDAEDYWDVSHAQAVISCFRKNYREIDVSYAVMGQKVHL